MFVVWFWVTALNHNFRYLALLLLCAALFGLAFCEARGDVLQRCEQYRPMFERLAKTYGMSAPLIASQVTQESACNPRARSPWAKGLSQFTDPTAKDMRRWYPNLLANFDVWEPEQAALALVLYMRRLNHMFRDAATECDKTAFSLSGYNSGPGWTMRDRRICRRAAECDHAKWWNHVERHHDNRRRASAIRESTEYPRRILKKWEPVYVSAWQGVLTCP